MSNILGQIGEQIGELGKQVVTETAKAPKDIVGKALESLGTSTSAKTPKQTSPKVEVNKPTGPMAQLNGEKDQNVRRAIARSALEQLAKRSKQKEPTVWEKLQQEQEQKKEQLNMQKAQDAKTNLAPIASKRPRGDLYGTKAKRFGGEVGKNVRQD